MRLGAENSRLKRELLELVAVLDDAERLRKLPDAGQEVRYACKDRCMHLFCLMLLQLSSACAQVKSRARHVSHRRGEIKRRLAILQGHVQA